VLITIRASDLVDSAELASELGHAAAGALTGAIAMQRRNRSKECLTSGGCLRSRADPEREATPIT
jgi:hypothetical protein